MKIQHLFIAFVIVAASACTSASDAGDANLSVAISALTSADIASVSVTVTGPGLTDMHAQLVLVGSTWQGTLGGIPAGDNRVFAGVANDAGGNPIYQGQSTPVTIVAGQTALVILELTPLMPPPAFGNHAPHINSVYVSSNAVAPGDPVQLAVGATDADGDPLTYAWTADPSTTFTAPGAASTTWSAATDGAYPLTITATDPHDAFDAVTVTINVSEANGRGAAEINAVINSYPQVQDLTLSTGHLQVGVPATATAAAFDADGNSLTYAWSDDCGGTWSGAGATAQVTLPAGSTATSCTIRVDVDDGHGGLNYGTLVVAVAPDPTPTVDPVVDSTFQSTDQAGANGQVELRVDAHDPNGDPVTVDWSANIGSVAPTANAIAGEMDALWTGPACFVGAATITATVTSPSGTSTVTFDVTSTAAHCYTIALTPNGVGIPAGNYYSNGGSATHTGSTLNSYSYPYTAYYTTYECYIFSGCQTYYHYYTAYNTYYYYTYNYQYLVGGGYRDYFVFDLSAVPTAETITGATLTASSCGAGAGGTWSAYDYSSDQSTIDNLELNQGGGAGQAIWDQLGAGQPIGSTAVSPVAVSAGRQAMSFDAAGVASLQAAGRQLYAIGTTYTDPSGSILSCGIGSPGSSDVLLTVATD